MCKLNLFLPRVWTIEGYYYPIFSELGITYENQNLPNEERFWKDFNWVYHWWFNPYNCNEIEWTSLLEQSTGFIDILGRPIYVNDIIRNTKTHKIYVIEWEQEKLSFVARNGIPDETLESFDITHQNWELVGNVHEDKDLIPAKYKEITNIYDVNEEYEKFLKSI